jgi:lambda repressor-like predicted transcriptional regulator
MNKLSIQKRAQIIGMLVEGNSLRATSRMANVSINTVTKLLIDVGTACAEYHDRVLRDLPCKRIQCDEIWAFCYAKEKNVPEEHKGEFGYGDVYTWTAICADTKLVASFFVGRRDADYAQIFMNDLKDRLRNRVQLTTDGLKVYLESVEGAFGGEIDFAQLVKLYGNSPSQEDQRRYSPAECSGIEIKQVAGTPDEKHI